MELLCRHCGRNDDLVVREVHEIPINPEDSTAYYEEKDEEPWQEVWCNHCNRTLADSLTIEYSPEGFLVTEIFENEEN